MPIKLQTYQSNVPAATLGSTPAAVQGAPLNVKDSAGFRLSQGVLSDMGKLGSDLMAREQKLNEERKAADIMDEANKYYETTRLFEHEYQSTKKGGDARDAIKDFEEFHTKQYQERSARFQGDPRLEMMWKKQAGQIQMGSTGRALDYVEQQDRVYKQNVTKAKTELYFQKIAEAPNDKAVNNLRTLYNAEIRAINSPEVADVLMAEADQGTAVTRINTALAKDRVEEAERLLSEYREAGVIGLKTDEMVKAVEAARTGAEAFKISEEIRTTMPGATKEAKLDKIKELAGDNREIFKAARGHMLQDHSDTLSMQKEQDELISDMFEARIQAAGNPEERKAIELQILSTPMRSNVRTGLLLKNSQGLKQPLVSDPAKLRELEGMVAKEAITQEEIDRQYKWYLADDDYKTQRSRVKEVGGNRIGAYSLSLEDRMSKAFSEDSSRTKAKTSRFKKEMELFVKEFQTNNSRLPSDKELAEHENWLLEKVVFDENWFGDRKTERFLLDSLEDKKFDVPAEYATQIRSQLKASGIEPTEDQVIQIYKAYLKDRK
jgi:hypothetical protein